MQQQLLLLLSWLKYERLIYTQWFRILNLTFSLYLHRSASWFQPSVVECFQRTAVLLWRSSLTISTSVSSFGCSYR